MTLLELVTWLGIGFLSYQFWRIRGISEYVNVYLQQYCEANQLQLLSIARNKTRLSFKYAKPDWLSSYYFEFSSDGKNRYTGEIQLIGSRVLSTTLPPYKI